MGRLFTRQEREREQRDELLSAYLDGQLSAGEQARLKTQLATDPALRVELEALHHAVALVRDLPPAPIPRNFILPQAMAARPRPARRARPRRAWAAPLLTAATAVASLLFVVVLAGDLLLSGAGGRAFAPAAMPPKEAEAPQLALQPSPISEEVEAEVEKMIPAATPLPMPTEVPPGTVPTVVVEAEVHDAAAPEGMETPEQAVGGGGPIEEPAAPAPAASPTVAEEAAAAPTAPATATAVPERGVGGVEPTPGAVTEVAPLTLEEEEANAAETERGEPEGAATGIAPALLWRVVEVALGLSALGLALAAVWAWRAQRGNP